MDAEVFHRDLLEVSADAVVVPTGVDLEMSSKVAKQIRSQCDGPVSGWLQRHDPVDPGTASVTPGYNIAPYLLHTITIPVDRTRAQNVRLATADALSQADALGCHQIALPSVGTGFGGLDTDVAMNVIGETIDAYQPENLSVAQIACINERTYDIATDLWSQSETPWVNRDQQQ